MAERGRAALLGLALLSGTTLAAEQDAAAEAQLLSTWSSTATRQGMRLQLKAANGQTVHFVSDHPEAQADAAGYVDYRLKAVTPDRKFFVVAETAYERASIHWVSRTTGQQVEVFTPPAVSPDGRYAVAALHWESFGPAGVFIWEIVDGQLVQRGHIEPADGYALFKFRRWTGKDSAELERVSHADPKFCPGSQGLMTTIVRLARGHTGWALASPAIAREVRCE